MKTLSSWLDSQRALCMKAIGDGESFNERVRQMSHDMPLALRVIEILIEAVKQKDFIVEEHCDECGNLIEVRYKLTRNKKALTEIDALLSANQKHEGDG